MNPAVSIFVLDLPTPTLTFPDVVIYSPRPDYILALLCFTGPAELNVS